MIVTYQRKRLAAAGVFLIVFALASGCGKKEDTASATPPASLKGQAPGVPAEAVKLTPEQEAARQKAIQQGPGIEAAIQAQQTGQPAPK